MNEGCGPPRLSLLQYCKHLPRVHPGSRTRGARAAGPSPSEHFTGFNPNVFVAGDAQDCRRATDGASELFMFLDAITHQNRVCIRREFLGRRKMTNVPDGMRNRMRRTTSRPAATLECWTTRARRSKLLRLKAEGLRTGTTSATASHELQPST